MDKEETKFAVDIMLCISTIIDQLDLIHKRLTEHLIQKGESNVKDPDSFDYRRN